MIIFVTLDNNGRDSHSGGPGFESRCRPTWLGFFSWFSSVIKANSGLDFSLPRSIWPLFIKFIKKKYPQLVSNTRSGRGMRCDEAPHIIGPWEQGCRQTTPDAQSQGRMKWNEMDEMSMEQWWNVICGRRKRENLPRLCFVQHETHMEWPRCEPGTTAMGGEHLSACTIEASLV